MNDNTEPNTESPSVSIAHREIKNFEISIDFSLYWISYEERHYPFIMTPYDFFRLFEIEGIPIKNFTGDEPVRFSKAVLVRAGYQVCGEVFNEGGDDITPQLFWVKDETEDTTTETLLVPTPY